MKFKLVEEFTNSYNNSGDDDRVGLVVEAVDPTKALKIKERSNYPIILYGWRYKNEPVVELEPEEHTDKSIEQRINQIVRGYDRLSLNGRTGNRYAKRKDFMFYILYNNSGYVVGGSKERDKNESLKEGYGGDIELEYDDLEIEVSTGSSSGRFDVGYGNWLPDDSYTTVNISWTYYADQGQVEEFLVDFVEEELSDEELKEYEQLEEDEQSDYLYNYLEEHFDDILDKHIDQVLDHFYDDAVYDAERNYEYDGYESLHEGKGKKNKKKKASWLGWWQPLSMINGSTNHNVGDNDYNNDMFNHMTGADGGEFGSLSSGGESSSSSSGAGDCGGGMGESLSTNNNTNIRNKKVRL